MFRIRLYLLIKEFFFRFRSEPMKRGINHLVVVYRISDVGYPKEKPVYINNENCLRNALAEFPLEECQWHVIADNVSENTLRMIYGYIPKEYVECVSVGHGAGTFRLAYEYALKYNDDDCIYFLENDYLHRPGSLDTLKEGIVYGKGAYVTLYDHPDKYGYDTANPLVYNGGEKTHVFLTKSCHWKYTNSTTMTFAAYVDVLRKDKDIFWKWTKTKHPYDFQIFIELYLKRKRRLLSAIPGYSTHGETKYLTPLTSWNKIAVY